MCDPHTDPPTSQTRDGGRDAADETGGSVPPPVRDDVTVELVRDAIGVARGERSDERFSEKYGTATDPTGERGPTPADGDRPDR